MALPGLSVSLSFIASCSVELPPFPLWFPHSGIFSPPHIFQLFLPTQLPNLSDSEGPRVWARWSWGRSRKGQRFPLPQRPLLPKINDDLNKEIFH